LHGSPKQANEAAERAPMLKTDSPKRKKGRPNLAPHFPKAY
jgi:hypothetical protein